MSDSEGDLDFQSADEGEGEASKPVDVDKPKKGNLIFLPRFLS